MIVTQLNPHTLPHITLPVDHEVDLRMLDVEQAGDVFDLVDANRELLSPWLPWVEETKTAEDSKEFIERVQAERLDGSQYGFGINYRARLVGHISLFNLMNDDADAEIGYWIDDTVAGKGIMTRCVRALTRFGLAELNLPRIVINADVRNGGSNKVAENSGYQLFAEGVSPDDRRINRWLVTPIQ